MCKLMCSAYQFKSIDVVEICRDFISKQPASTSTIHSPSTNIILSKYKKKLIKKIKELKKES